MSINTIKDKVVVIAGGAKNLGGLIAEDFAKQGAKAIVVHYNSSSTQASVLMLKLDLRPDSRHQR